MRGRILSALGTRREPAFSEKFFCAFFFLPHNGLLKLPRED